ncbi:MAG: fibronectin type III domain-containing protein [Rhizobiales bacterium]|nr:fibronectin type III domain-containing protein [Hyphomicrobiales bacterium]
MFDRLLWSGAASAIYTLAAVVLFAVCGSVHATTFLAWTADCTHPCTNSATGTKAPPSGGSSDNFTLSNGAPGTSISTSIKHSGSGSLKTVAVGNDGGNQPEGAEPLYQGLFGNYFPGTFSGSTRYYRWWMRIESGWSWGNSGVGDPVIKVIRESTPTGQWFTVLMTPSGFQFDDCDSDGVGGSHAGECYNNTGAHGSSAASGINVSYTHPTDSTWREYILKIKEPSSFSCTPGAGCDSEFTLYINGTQVSTNTGWKIVPDAGTADAAGFHFPGTAGPYFQIRSSVAAGGTFYWDDFSVDDTFNSIAGGGDTTAPTVPASLSCPSSTTTGITCTWSASTDAVGVTSYPLERRSLPDGGAWTQIAAPAGTSYADTVPAMTRYEYRVSAKDAAGNQSAPSTSVTATSHLNLAFGYGVNLPLEFRDGTWDAGQREAALDAIEFMCGTSCWVRMDVTHSTVEATQGVYDWSSYDTRIAEINAHGFQKMLMLGYSPAWNRDGACSTSNAMPVSGAAFGAFVGAAVARFTPDAVEFWNEPNAINFSCPSVSASNYYTKVLEPGYNAAKAARPATAVILGGTGPATDVGCTGTTPNVTCTTSRTSIGWLTDLYGIATVKEHWDGIGFHPYTNSTQPPGTAYTTGLGTGWMQMEQRTEGSGSLRTLMTNNAQSALKIVTTEWGIPTSGSGNMGSVSVTSQANDWVKQGFGILAGKSWAGPSVWYVLTDRCATTANEECWFGLLQQDLVTKKRSFGAFKALANPLAAPGRDKFRPR